MILAFYIPGALVVGEQPEVMIVHLLDETIDVIETIFRNNPIGNCIEQEALKRL